MIVKIIKECIIPDDGDCLKCNYYISAIDNDFTTQPSKCNLFKVNSWGTGNGFEKFENKQIKLCKKMCENKYINWNERFQNF